MQNKFEDITSIDDRQTFDEANNYVNTMNEHLTTLDQLKDQHYGLRGNAKRDALENGYESFKIGTLIHDARIEKGLTQQQLADKVGTTKSYISKIENNIKEIRISSLQQIIEKGLGGHLELSIKF